MFSYEGQKHGVVLWLGKMVIYHRDRLFCAKTSVSTCQNHFYLHKEAKDKLQKTIASEQLICQSIL